MPTPADRQIDFRSNALENLEPRRLMAALPFSLDFDAAVPGTVLDKDGQGTGFAGVQANKLGDAHQPSLIDLDTASGTLRLTTRGTASTGGNSKLDNTLVNLLETDFDATKPFEVTTRITGGLRDITDGFEQAGLAFGPGQDDYAKLVAIFAPGEGLRIQFADEYSNGDGTVFHTVSEGRVSANGLASAEALELRIVADPSAGRLVASYRFDAAAAWTQIAHTITVPADKRAAFFSATGKAGLIAFDKSDAENLTVGFDRFEVRRPAVGATAPRVVTMRPGVNATNVLRDTFVAVDLSLPNGAVDGATVNTTSVFLRNDKTGQIVPAAATVSGGGDAITLTPGATLQANARHTFVLTSNVKDLTGRSFDAFSGSFTTGQSVAESDPRVAFDRLVQTPTENIPWTGLSFGPDGNLYGVTAIGDVFRMAVGSDGTLSEPRQLYSFVGQTGEMRLITGLTFDTSAPQLTAYVSHGAFVAPGDETNRNAPEWSGRITRLSGPDLASAQDVIVGLPRSVYDHLNNQPVFGPDGRLYFVSPSNTAMGAADSTWGNRPEQLLSAAVLAADVRTISGTLDVKTAEGGTYDPYADGAKVKIYATGIRNGYALVFTPDGRLYVPANGSAAGGNTPAGPGNSPPAINGVARTQHDYLFQIVEGGYYGHPNPLRGEYVLNGGNPTGGADRAEVDQYPVGTAPDADYKGFAYDFGLNVSPNGAIRYDSGGKHFGGALDGRLLVTRYSGGDDLLALQLGADGNVSKAFSGSLGTTGFSDPLDVVQHPTTGHLYVVEAGFRTQGGKLQISLLKALASGATANVTAPRLRDGALHFSDVRGDATPGIAHRVTITNGGTGDLALPSDALTIGGPAATRFEVANAASLPRKLSPGQSFTFDLRFTADSVGIVDATLSIKTNDAAATTRTVRLRGLGTAGEGGNLEPSLQRILDLYNLPIQTGDPDPATTDYPQQRVVAASQEVTLQTLDKAGPGPVTIELLASMGTANANSFSDTSALSYYAAATGNKTPLFTVSKAQAQTVNATPNGSTSFDPAGPFGLVATFNDFGPRDVWSEDTRNTFESDADQRRKLRFFPLRDADGSVVPNAYVFAFEEWDVATDQNDLVGIVRNVKPAGVAAKVGVENADGVPFDDRLIFSRIRDKDPIVPNYVHDRTTLRVRNDGTADLVLNGVSVSNADFQILSGGTASGPITIEPGQSHAVEVKFVYNHPSDRRVKVRTAELRLTTNDPATPTRVVELAGLWQSHSEEGNTGTSQEGNLNDLARLFGWTVDVGPDTGKSDFATGQNTQGKRIAVGGETLSNSLLKAGPGPVVVTQLAAYHQQRDPEWNGTGSPRYVPNTAFNWYSESDPTRYRFLFKHHKEDGQTILPRLENASGIARGSFDPGAGAFGFSVDRSHHLDFARNPKNASLPDGSHALRLFALRDRGGQVIPGAYLAAKDNSGSSFANYDYQDDIYLLTNVRPAEGPSAPKSVAATASDGGAVLTWAANAENNVTGYDVFRADSAGGAYTKITASPVSATSFNDATAPVGEKRFYRVAAVDYHGTAGARSPEVSATRPDAATKPAAPSAPVASAEAFNSVTLAWDDLSNNEESFRIERAVGNGGFSPLTTLAANATEYVDTTTAERTSYRYRVVAVNAAGASAGPATSVSTPGDPANVAAPTGLHVVEARHDGVSLAWADNSDNEQRFVLERRVAPEGGTAGPWTAVVTLPAETVDHADATVADRTRYEYRLFAESDAGRSAPSSVIVATTPRDPARVDPPAGLSVASNGHARVVLNWINNSDNERSFRVERALGDGPFSKLADADANARSFADETVSPRTAYRYRVIAVGEFGQSPASNVAATTTQRDPAEIAAPTNLRPTGVSHNRVSLAWDDASDNEDNFAVERAAGDGPYARLATLARDATEYADVTARPGTSYRYRVVALNDAGGRAEGEAATVTTPADPTQLAKPRDLAAAAVSPTQVELTWRDLADNESGYVVERRAGNGEFAMLATLGADATGYTDATAAAGTSYAYRVAASNAVARSDFSNEATLTTPAADALFDANIGGATGSTNTTAPGRDLDLRVVGGNVSDSSDALRFAHRSVTGDFDYVVRLDGFDKSGPAAAAGIMARDGLSPSARNLFLRASGQSRLSFRTADGGSTGGAGLANTGVPVWLRLRREGDAFIAYTGNDGRSWTELARDDGRPAADAPPGPGRRVPRRGRVGRAVPQLRRLRAGRARRNHEPDCHATGADERAPDLGRRQRQRGRLPRRAPPGQWRVRHARHARRRHAGLRRRDRLRRRELRLPRRRL